MNGRGRFASSRGRRGGPLGSAVRGIAGGVGLVSESVSQYGKQNRSQASQSDQSPPIDGLGSEFPLYDQEDVTRRQWVLDETQSELLQVDGSENPPLLLSESESEQQIAAGFIRSYAELIFHSEPGSVSRLELPVILAQRRPKTRTRGFVRAYAPDLANVGIDQSTWLEFLDSFDKSTRASPWLKAINLASVPGALAPIGIGMAINVAVALTVKVAMDVQERQRTNKFLSKMNAEFFHPRGVCCLIMTWKPESSDHYQDIDLDSVVANSVDSYHNGFLDKFKSSSGKTYEELALPEAAQLVFPTLDVLGAADSNEAKGVKQSLQSKKRFVDEYYDMRAQSEFANENLDNLLANQQQSPRFSSRYADPSHPSNNGSLISLLTGGYVDPTRLTNRFDSTNKPRLGGRSTLKPGRQVKEFVFKKDVLYLMVVNMPTDEELAGAMQFLGDQR